MRRGVTTLDWKEGGMLREGETGQEHPYTKVHAIITVGRDGQVHSAFKRLHFVTQPWYTMKHLLTITESANKSLVTYLSPIYKGGEGQQQIIPF